MNSHKEATNSLIGNRALLILVCWINGIAAIAFFIAFDFAEGFGWLTILSNFREWDLRGVISQEGLQEYKEGLYSEDWAKLPSELHANAFRYMTFIKIACVSLLLTNVAILLSVLYRQRRLAAAVVSPKKSVRENGQGEENTEPKQNEPGE